MIAVTALPSSRLPASAVSADTSLARLLLPPVDDGGATESSGCDAAGAPLEAGTQLEAAGAQVRSRRVSAAGSTDGPEGSAADGLCAAAGDPPLSCGAAAAEGSAAEGRCRGGWWARHSRAAAPSCSSPRGVSCPATLPAAELQGVPAHVSASSRLCGPMSASAITSALLACTLNSGTMQGCGLWCQVAVCCLACQAHEAHLTDANSRHTWQTTIHATPGRR